MHTPDWEMTAADLLAAKAQAQANLREWQTVAAAMADELDDYRLRMAPSVRRALSAYRTLAARDLTDDSAQ